MNEQRYRRILSKLAAVHLPQAPAQQMPLAPLAAALAGKGALVLICGFSPLQLERQESLVNLWVDLYGQLYQRLARDLFPSFTALDAVYADDNLPVAVVLTAQITPILNGFAGHVVPYVAARQGEATHPTEIRKLMDGLLADLEAGDLSREAYRLLVVDCVDLIGQLLALPVQHVSLTDFAQPFVRYQPVELPPPPAAGAPAPPAEYTQQVRLAPAGPDTLPESPGYRETATREMFRRPIPVMPTGRTKPARRPPVPDLPPHLRG
jgi:hypothetical protein